MNGSTNGNCTVFLIALKLQLTRPESSNLPSTRRRNPPRLRDTLFDLPSPQTVPLGMRDAVKQARLDELERQEKEGNYPSDKSRGKKADDYEIRRNGRYVRHSRQRNRR